MKKTIIILLITVVSLFWFASVNAEEPKKETGEACMSPAECLTGKCFESVCVCDLNSDCPEDYYCKAVDLQCHPLISVGGNCTVDAECKDSDCVGEVCTQAGLNKTACCRVVKKSGGVDYSFFPDSTLTNKAACDEGCEDLGDDCYKSTFSEDIEESMCKAGEGVCCTTKWELDGIITTKLEFILSEDSCKDKVNFYKIIDYPEDLCEGEIAQASSLKYGCCTLVGKLNEKTGIVTTAHFPHPNKEACDLWCGEKGGQKCIFDAETDYAACVAKKATTAQSKEDPFAGLTKISDYKQLEVKNVPDLIGNLIKTALGFIGSIALVMFVGGGLLWMTSMGNSERQKKAMNMILWSSLGVLVILSSYVIVSFVLRAFGV